MRPRNVLQGASEADEGAQVAAASGDGGEADFAGGLDVRELFEVAQDEQLAVDGVELLECPFDEAAILVARRDPRRGLAATNELAGENERGGEHLGVWRELEPGVASLAQVMAHELHELLSRQEA